MTDAYVHDTYVKMPTYPDEFKPLLKLFNLALMCKEVTDVYLNQSYRNLWV